MRVGIIAAMDEELALLIERVEERGEVRFGQFQYHTGRIGPVEVALLLCGIGKVNAAVGATLLIDKLAPDYLVNIGVAGGFLKDIKVGDIVVSTEVRHHDADATVFDYEFGQIPRMPPAFKADPRLVAMAGAATLADDSVTIFKGPILSGDSFIHQPDQIELIVERFPEIMAVEMEGAAIAQTCYLFGIPFVLIRSISDKVREAGSHEIYQDSLERAAANSVGLVLALIDRLREEG